MKNCIIIHGCPSDEAKVKVQKSRTFDKHWIPCVAEHLLEKGISALTPQMPSSWRPDYQAWKKEFSTLKVDNDTVLVGHSCACAFLVRWLGETGVKISKLILVAPWKIDSEDDLGRTDFYRYSIDKSIKYRVGEIVLFTSDNEDSEGKASLRIFQNAIGGRTITLNGHGHYTLKDMDTDEFPELLEIIMKK